MIRRGNYNADRFRTQRDTKRIALSTFTVELPVPPSTNNLFATNSKTGRRFPSKEYDAWRKEAAQMLMAQRARVAIGPVAITITVQEGRGDIDNRIKAVIDCLVLNGIIDGDTSKTVRSVTARWGDVVGALVEIAPAQARAA